MPLVLVLFTTFFVACSEAKFHGGSKARTNAANPSGPTPTPGATPGATPDPNKVLDCSVTPRSVKLGRTVSIQLQTKLTESLKQTISGAGTTAVSNLSYSAGTYVLESGEANNFNPKKEGTYTIELRRGANLKPDASCSFTVTPKTVTVEPCQDGKQILGAHLAFLIDNSNSNAATDCPSPIKTGAFKGASLYSCQGQTNREKAVLTAFDILNSVAAKANQTSAQSSLAIASFPTKQQFIDGWKEQTGFVQVNTASRATVANAMQFSREPYGLTPYGAAMNAAEHLFSGLAQDNKARVAVLVTDGEPTDRDPRAVAEKARSLRSRGVDVITVFVTGNASRHNRQQGHGQLLQNIDVSSIEAGEGHWYTNDNRNFASYMRTILDLPVHVAGANQVVEVQDASALESVFMEIIESKAIKCEK